MSIFKRLLNIVKSNLTDLTWDGEPIDWEKYTEKWTRQYGEQARRTTPPFSEQEQKYFALLEMPPTKDFEEIRKHYKMMIKKYHPDKFNTDEEKRKIAETITVKLNEAEEYFEKRYKK